MSTFSKIMLLKDECECCRYTDQALSMANVTPHPCLVDDLANEIKKLDSDNYIIFTCVNNLTRIEEQYKHNVVLIHDNSLPDINNHKLQIPFNLYTLKHTINIASKNIFSDQISMPDVFEHFIGNSSEIIKIKKMIAQVAKSDSNVLIHGESGTGKDVIANCIHLLSDRKMKPYVPINCGAIPQELIESELFGHEKGAFTGASAKRAGRFEIANQGTLFLDEIGDMPLSMQVKLLRVIQDKSFERIGSSQRIETDVRIIAASNKNLEILISQNQFREDLYYRLNVIPISVPALRERTEDIPVLIDYFLEKISKRIPHQTVFTEDAIEELCTYDWPGNIRQLANFIERMVVMYNEAPITANDISQELHSHKSKSNFITIPDNFTEISYKEYLSSVEQQLIKLALEKNNNVIASAADFLNMGRTTLIEKMKKYEINIK